MTLALRQSLKKKLRHRELTIGSWITLGHASIAEILAQAGFEWLVIDLEHTSITIADVQHLIQVIELGGCSPLVRVGENNPSLIKRVMDLGAHGVVVPLVNSKEEAQAAVRAVRYPPVGTRGVGLGRAQGYGADFEGYRDRREKESIVIVQIEHIQAVDRLEAILSVEGIDGFLVGPYDLSGSLGVPGQFEHPAVQGALQRIQTVAAQTRMAAGIHVIPPDPQKLLSAVHNGFRLIVFSFDALFLGEIARSSLKAARALVAQNELATAGRV